MPVPVSVIDTATYSPGVTSTFCAAYSSSSTALRSRSRGCPPFGMASRALTARLRIASSSCDGSASAGHRFVRQTQSCTAMCSPSVRCSSVTELRDDVVEVEIARLQRLLAREGEQRWVSCAPRVGGLVDRLDDRRELRIAAQASSDSSSVMPMMTVRMLLKSCATPPVSWPTASIFCAWRSWLSSATRSVMSRPMKKYCPSGSDQIPVHLERHRRGHPGGYSGTRNCA